MIAGENQQRIDAPILDVRQHLSHRIGGSLKPLRTLRRLLGSKYLSLVPGGDSKTLEAGQEIRFTQSPVNLESLIGQFMFSGKGGSGGESGNAPAAPPSAPSGDGQKSGMPGGTL